MMSRSLQSRSTVVALALAFVACSGVQGPFVWADQYPALAPSTGYLVGPGDALTIQVWNSDKISTKTRVRSDGRISVPLINDLDAAGKTPEQLGQLIQERLVDAKLVTTPRVTVIVDEVKPVTVSVLGNVSRVGMYALDAGSGVAEALASAGGLTPFAHDDRIFVLRKTPEPVRIRFTFASLTDQTERASTFRLRSGDVVLVQ